MDQRPGSGWRRFVYIIVSFVAGVCALVVAGFLYFLMTILVAVGPPEDPYDWVLQGQAIILNHPDELDNISQQFADYPTLGGIGDGNVSFADATGRYQTITLEEALGLGDSCTSAYVPDRFLQAESRIREAFFFLASINAQGATAGGGRIGISFYTKTHSVFGGSLIWIQKLPDGPPSHMRGRPARHMAPREWSPPSGEFRWMHIADDWYVVLEFDG